MVTGAGWSASFVDAARHHAAARPDEPAIVDPRACVTWAQLDGEADDFVDYLATLGLGTGDRIGSALTADARSIVALLGALRAGLVTVLVDPRLSPVEVAALMSASGAADLVTVGGIAPTVLPGIRVIDAAGGSAASPARARAILPGELVVPTSGTTGRPRLARLPLDRIAASVQAWRAVLPPARAWLLSLGLSHVAGIGIVARAAADGVPVVIPASSHPDEMLRAIRDARAEGFVVSHLSLVAAQLTRLLDATDDAPPPEGVAAVLLGGGPIPEVLVRRATAVGWPVLPSFGMTETASGVVAMRPGDARERPWSAGRALPGVSLRIGAGGTAADVPGELWVRGPMLFAGYLDDAEATTTRFDEDGWFRTGDLCSIDAEGWLRVIDRLDDVVVSGGEKVIPADVEAGLMACLGVADAGMVGVADHRWGRVPVAVVVPRRGWDPTDGALRDQLRTRLAPWKVPARFLRAAALPRGGGGKLLRRVLAEWVAGADLALAAEGADQPGGERPRIVLVDDGQALAVRLMPGSAGELATGPSVAAVLVLHATLSSSAQLMGLGRQLRGLGSVLLLDRRGSGGSPMARPAPVSIARHVADAVAALDACGVERAIVVGHSFGGVVALELAARHPARVVAVAAWEPPYIPLLSEPERGRLLGVAGLVAGAHASGGSSAAAEAFIEVVSGPGAWQHLRPAQRAAIEAAGDGALADAAMPDLDIDGLSAIRCPVVLATGGLSDPLYASIVAALGDRIASAQIVSLPGLRHSAPITRPDAFAVLVRRLGGSPQD